MSDDGREAFLARVREAVREGNRAGAAPPLPERGSLSYQGAGGDPVTKFCQEFEAAGGKAHVVSDEAAALRAVLVVLVGCGARRVLLGSGTVIDRIALATVLVGRGLEVLRVSDLKGDATREAFFAADVGVTGVRALIAETGSLVVETGAGQPRSESLLPPVHVVVADRSQLLADLFDLFPDGDTELPSCRTVITGPSKTGDIELRLVTGVHGPGEVHVVLLG